TLQLALHCQKVGPVKSTQRSSKLDRKIESGLPRDTDGLEPPPSQKTPCAAVAAVALAAVPSITSNSVDSIRRATRPLQADRTFGMFLHHQSWRIRQEYTIGYTFD
ncbi:MAG: hypothetical protein MUE46_20915, partial [Xanthomonadales bacterium]|nr:hypothetical protein [Xanthomonadales bacterium]